MQRLLALLATAALAVLAPSCFLSRQTTNVPLKDNPFGEVVPGQTTATEIVERFGAPNEIVQLARRSAYLYSFRPAQGPRASCCSS